jgi:hypothetical protein
LQRGWRQPRIDFQCYQCDANGVQNTLNVIRHVSQLIALNDNALVDALYRTLLKRAPDPDGMEFYVSQLRSGLSKGIVIADFAASPEASAAGLELPGLQKFIAAQKWRARSPLRMIGYGREREMQMHRLENGLGRLLSDVNDLKRQTQRRFEAIEYRLQLTNEEGPPLPVESTMALPGEARAVDLSGVPLIARRIFRELSAAVEAAEKPKAT